MNKQALIRQSLQYRNGKLQETGKGMPASAFGLRKVAPMHCPGCGAPTLDAAQAKQAAAHESLICRHETLSGNVADARERLDAMEKSQSEIPTKDKLQSRADAAEAALAEAREEVAALREQVAAAKDGRIEVMREAADLRLPVDATRGELAEMRKAIETFCYQDYSCPDEREDHGCNRCPLGKYTIKRARVARAAEGEDSPCAITTRARAAPLPLLGARNAALAARKRNYYLTGGARIAPILCTR